MRPNENNQILLGDFIQMFTEELMAEGFSAPESYEIVAARLNELIDPNMVLDAFEEDEVEEQLLMAA